MTSPMQHSLKHFRDLGYAVGISEHWNGFCRRRVDLFGFCDLVCAGGGCITAVQTTSTPNVNARLSKILSIPEAKTWLLNGGKILILGWAKRGPRGKRKVWTCKELEVTLAMFSQPSE